MSSQIFKSHIPQILISLFLNTLIWYISALQKMRILIQFLVPVDLERNIQVTLYFWEYAFARNVYLAAELVLILVAGSNTFLAKKKYELTLTLIFFVKSIFQKEAGKFSQPFNLRSHKMVKHPQTIRRQQPSVWVCLSVFVRLLLSTFEIRHGSRQMPRHISIL